MLPWIILGGIVAIGLMFGLWLMGAYNGLVAMRQKVRAAWAQIDVQLKRRHDLIPNLVETVKGYAAHEKGTLEAVIAARNVAVAASGDPAKAAAAEGALNGAVRQLFALSEAYPDLKANQNFAQLQAELSQTENQIGSQRGNYNNLTASYNTQLQSFPTNMIAGPFGFTEQAFFQIQEPAEREAPQVKF